MRPGPLPARLVPPHTLGRARVRRVRPPRARGPERLWPLLAIGAGSLVAVAVFGQAVSAVPWVFVVLIASAAAFFAVRSILRGAREPETFGAREPPAGERSGELRAFGEALERARSGHPYSQAIVTARVASAFLEKVRLTRGLSPSELEAARNDRAALLRLIGDEELVDFVSGDNGFGQESTKVRGAATAGKQFGAALSRVLEAMEAWS